VLRIETIVPVSVQDVWDAWTTSDGLKEWIAPVVAIDLRVGGVISTNYEKTARIGDAGTIRLPIINYIERELITLKVQLNDSFTQKVRRQDQTLQKIVQIVDLRNGETKGCLIDGGMGHRPGMGRCLQVLCKGQRLDVPAIGKLSRFFPSQEIQTSRFRIEEASYPVSMRVALAVSRISAAIAGGVARAALQGGVPVPRVASPRAGGFRGREVGGVDRGPSHQGLSPDRRWPPPVGA